MRNKVRKEGRGVGGGGGEGQGEREREEGRGKEKKSSNVDYLHATTCYVQLTSGFSILLSFSFAFESKRSRSWTTFIIALRTPSSCIPS